MKEASRKLLEKADRSLRVATSLQASGEAEFSVSRTYYAMFYTAEALLNERGLHFRKHGGVHAAFGEQFSKTGVFDPKYHRWLLEAFNKRITSDYEIESGISLDEAATLIRQAREFLQQAQGYLAKIPT